MTKTVDRSYDSYYSVSSMYAYNYRILYMSCICTYLSCVSKRAATSSLISLLRDRARQPVSSNWWKGKSLDLWHLILAVKRWKCFTFDQILQHAAHSRLLLDFHCPCQHTSWYNILKPHKFISFRGAHFGSYMPHSLWHANPVVQSLWVSA